MKIFRSSRWEDGFLDYHLEPRSARIDVCLVFVVRPVRNVYIEYGYKWEMIWNYVREIGFAEVFRKILSRVKESKGRNQKFLFQAVGYVHEAGDGSRFVPGQLVSGIVTCHPLFPDRICVPDEFLSPVDIALPWLDRNEVLLFDRIDEWGKAAEELEGWVPESGWELPRNEIQRLVQLLLSDLLVLGQPKFRVRVSRSDVITSTRNPRVVGSKELTAVCYGYGHYAKVTLLPNLHSSIKLVRIHELDPMQLGLVKKFPLDVDSSPFCSADLRFDVSFIAGFHHTHCQLALNVLACGGVAVVEKPLVTTRSQLLQLERALAAHHGRFFACFQKRYSEFNDYLFDDLNCKIGDPIHMSAVVYEIDLPLRHWYKWPVSRSPIVSNACHWLDYFLFINSFSEPKKFNLSRFGQDGFLISVELHNGASLVLNMSDMGSRRIGVREYIELKRPSRLVTIQNGGYYCAESDREILRTSRINKLSVYGGMYRKICDRIVAGLPGDSFESVSVSCRLMLSLDELWYDIEKNETNSSKS